MSLANIQPSYQQLVFFARQLPLDDRIRLVRDILADPTEQLEEREVYNQKDIALEPTLHHRYQVQDALAQAGLLQTTMLQATRAIRLSHEERAALARRLGEKGRPLSKMIIEEREAQG